MQRVLSELSDGNLFQCHSKAGSHIMGIFNFECVWMVLDHASTSDVRLYVLLLSLH